MNPTIRNNNLSPHCRSFVENARELKEKDPLTYGQLFSHSLAKRIAIPSINGFGWMSLQGNPTEYDIPKLKLFHHLTQSFKFIESSDYLETFESRFIDGKGPKGKLICSDSATLVAVLFRDLQRREGISGRCKLYDQLSISFMDKNQEPLKRDSLERMASRGVSREQQNDINNLLQMLFA